MLARFQSSKKRPPCSETLGMELIALDQAAQKIRVKFEASPSFTNPMGSVQGGFVAAMLDEAMSMCALIASNITMSAPTLEFKVSFMRPLFPGKAEAEARILKFGRSTAFIESELYDADGKMVAKASATAALKPFKRID